MACLMDSIWLRYVLSSLVAKLTGRCSADAGAHVGESLECLAQGTPCLSSGADHDDAQRGPASRIGVD
jgi:hypothetical protein